MKPPKFPWNGKFSFTDDEIALIDRINNSLTRPLSPRWIYYNLFDTPDAKQQRFLNHVLKKARLDNRQYISRDNVTDDTRTPIIWNVSENLYNFIADLNYTRDIWQSQPRYYEVWVEDQASLQAVIKSPRKIIQEYRINARYCKGFNSIGAMHESYKFFNEIDKPITILYYGDLNPSGWAIPVIIVRQFEEMGLEIELKRMALNIPQLKKYDIPAYTKISADPRRKEFNQIFGYDEWESQPKQPYKDESTGKIKHGKKHLNIDLEKIPIEDFENMLLRDLNIHINKNEFEKELALENEESIKLDEIKKMQEGG